MVVVNPYGADLVEEFEFVVTNTRPTITITNEGEIDADGTIWHPTNVPTTINGRVNSFGNELAQANGLRIRESNNPFDGNIALTAANTEPITLAHTWVTGTSGITAFAPAADGTFSVPFTGAAMNVTRQLQVVDGDGFDMSGAGWNTVGFGSANRSLATNVRFAQLQGEVWVESGQIVEVGSRITVPVFFAGENFSGMELRLAHNAGLTLVSSHARAEFNDYFTPFSQQGFGGFLTAESDIAINTTTNEALFYLVFDVADDAEYDAILEIELFFENAVNGTTPPHRLVARPGAPGFFDTVDLSFRLYSGYVRVEDPDFIPVVGDANEDGRITSADSTLFARHIANPASVSIETRNMDLSLNNNTGTDRLEDLGLLVDWLVGRGAPPAVLAQQ
jgi:hypothetical protein